MGNNPGIVEKIRSSLSFLSKGGQGGAQSAKTLGVNIGKSAICVSLIQFHSGTPELIACKRSLIDPKISIPIQVKKIASDLNVDDAQIHSSLKGQGVIIRFLTFPKMAAADFASSLKFEAEKYLPFSADEVELDFHINADKSVPGKDQPEAVNMNVILIAAKKKEVEQLLDRLKPLNRRPKGIDVDIFSCANALERAIPETKNQVVGIIDFGAVDTTLCVSDKGTIAFSRDIAFGGNDLADSIRKTLDITIDEARAVYESAEERSDTQAAAIESALERFFQELKLSVNYYFNQQQNADMIDLFYISGGLSQLRGLDAYISEKMEVPVKKWNPTIGMKIGSNLKQEEVDSLAAFLPVSIGLALRSS